MSSYILHVVTKFWISVFKNYVSQLRISLVTTGSDALLLLFFKRLSDEIGYRSHTCLGSIKIQNYVREFLRKTEHLFFSVKKTKNLFYFLGTWPLSTFEKGVKGMQIGISNSIRAHLYTQTIPLIWKKSGITTFSAVILNLYQFNKSNQNICKIQIKYKFLCILFK